MISEQETEAERVLREREIEEAAHRLDAEEGVPDGAQWLTAEELTTVEPDAPITVGGWYAARSCAGRVRAEVQWSHQGGMRHPRLVRAYLDR